MAATPSTAPRQLLLPVRWWRQQLWGGTGDSFSPLPRPAAAPHSPCRGGHQGHDTNHAPPGRWAVADSWRRCWTTAAAVPRARSGNDRGGRRPPPPPPPPPVEPAIPGVREGGHRPVDATGSGGNGGRPPLVTATAVGSGAAPPRYGAASVVGAGRAGVAAPPPRHDRRPLPRGVAKTGRPPLAGGQCRLGQQAGGTADSSPASTRWCQSGGSGRLQRTWPSCNVDGWTVAVAFGQLWVRPARQARAVPPRHTRKGAWTTSLGAGGAGGLRPMHPRRRGRRPPARGTAQR